MVTLLVCLETFVALFVALHNWVRIGSLSDPAGVRAVFPTRKLLATTALNFVPVAFGLVATVFYFSGPFPSWLVWYLWIFYVLAIYGSLKEWWIPYFGPAQAARPERYRTMYETTYSFLPERNGVRPNTLHVIFDVAVIAILVDLAVLRR